MVVNIWMLRLRSIPISSDALTRWPLHRTKSHKTHVIFHGCKKVGKSHALGMLKDVLGSLETAGFHDMTGFFGLRVTVRAGTKLHVSLWNGCGKWLENDTLPRKPTVRPWKMMVGRLFPFWNGPFFKGHDNFHGGCSILYIKKWWNVLRTSQE